MAKITKFGINYPKRLFYPNFGGRLAESFEGLNSSLAQSTGKLRGCKVSWKYWLYAGF